MKEKKAFDSHTTKIVIAEDELLVRVGLKSIIPWEKYNLELVSEFFNGDELLQYIRKYPPHILLLDIKLPGSSGLDILKIIHDENLPIQVIVISSWDDCYTMKQAMQLGAYEYIHKPQMTSTQLLEMILKIQAQLLHDNIRSNSRICKDKNSLIDFNIENWLSVKCANSFVLIYFTVHKNDKMENITTQKTVTSFIQEFISAKKEISLVSYMQNGCTLSVFSNDVSEHNFLKKISLLTNTLNANFKRFFNAKSIYGISKTCNADVSFQQALDQAQQAYASHFFSEKIYSYYSDSQIVSNCVEHSQFQDLLKKIHMAFQQRNLENILMLIDQFQLAVPSEINNNKEELLYLIGTFLYEMADNQFSFYNDCTHELEKCGTFREVMNLFRCIIQGWYDKPLDKESHSTAFQIKNYVDKNYYSDISLIALSEELHLTSSYISRLFKKEFGINLFEYITEIRIQSAKDLLKSTDFKIYEIAERIGFKSTINFNYAFKRITGVSPSKYRDN